jgi:hypothetical protein
VQRTLNFDHPPDFHPAHWDMAESPVRTMLRAGGEPQENQLDSPLYKRSPAAIEFDSVLALQQRILKGNFPYRIPSFPAQQPCQSELFRDPLE